MERIIDSNGAGVGMLGIPFDAYSSHARGAAEAPGLIRQALWSPAANSWAESGVDVGRKNLIFDAADIGLNDVQDPFGQIEKGIEEMVKYRMVPVCLGGDHSVTIPVVRALHRAIAPFHILHFDAHPDLYESFQGDVNSHACPFARIMEERLTDRLVQVGVRTINDHQKQQADRYRVEQIPMKEIKEDTILTFDAPVYISLDIDALDPAFAPGVSHPEPGGLTTRQMIQLIQRLRAPAIVGADLVEYNPRQDLNGMTAVVCAKLVKEMVAAIVILNHLE